MGVSIVITSGKGGTGKTTVTAGLASCLAALDRTVICVDADVGARNLDIALGMSETLDTALDLTDALRDPESPDTAMTVHPRLPGLRLISAPLTRAFSDLDTGAFRPLVRTLCEQADYVLVDCCAGLETGFHMAVGACERAIVVSTAELPSLRVAARAASLLNLPGHAALVVNRINPKLIRAKYAPDIDEMMDVTGLPLLGLVPEDEMIPAAAHKGIAPVLAGGTGAASALLRIARRLTGEAIPLRRMRRWQVTG